MPPKKGKGASAKTQQKQESKKVEDKTFGLKNKNKSKAVQKYIKTVQHQVKGNAKGGFKSEEQLAAERRAEKERKKQELDEMANLFKPVIEKQKTAQGEDPKSVLCQFYVQGKCKKGRNCKFSHDMSLERKAAKINVYEDPREQDTMDDWDQEKLEEVIRKKHGAENQNLETTIVCKFFIEALEKNLYGWFWECPNGGLKCKYRHRLPPGFVLKKDMPKDDDGPKISLEEQIEEERAALKGGTPLNKEIFFKWKQDKIDAAAKAEEAKMDEKSKAFKKNDHRNLTGRDLFTFDPTLFVDDDEAADDYEREEADDYIGEIRAGDAAEEPVAVQADLFMGDDIDEDDLSD